MVSGISYNQLCQQSIVLAKVIVALNYYMKLLHYTMM